MSNENYFVRESSELDVMLKDIGDDFFTNACSDDDLSESLPVSDSVFSQRDDYGSLMQAELSGSAVYEYGPVISRPLAFNTPLPRVSTPYSFSRPRYRYVVSGAKAESRFLFSLAENGVKESFIHEHLESIPPSVPYLVGAYHGLLGMALIGAAVTASNMRDVYERASPEVMFPFDGEVPYAMGNQQDLPLPASTRWLASLCAPVRFNAAAPVTADEFLPQMDDVIRWRALRDRYRCREYQSSLPAGVGVCRPVGSRLQVMPVNEADFYASRRHPVFVTLPSGTIIMMCLNTADGFGNDRHNPVHNPLLNWAIAKLHRTGGVNAVYRHGLQRTIFALLAEECYNAHLEGRRPDVPWVGGNAKTPLLPAILDHEVVYPEASSDDLFRHVLTNPL